MLKKEQKDLRKLDVETLESRRAPFTIYTEPVPEEPLVGSGTTSDPVEQPVDQPGQSDDKRATLWHENQE